MKRNKKIGYVLAFFLGALGVHAIYYKKYRGILYALVSIIFPVLIPLTVILGWIDMFFISKWHEELEDEINTKNIEQHDSISTVVKEKEKVDNAEKDDVKHEKSNNIISNLLNSISIDSNLFYNEQDHILEKYAHLKTPDYIMDGVQQATNKNRFNNKNDDDLPFDIHIQTPEIDFLMDSIKYKNKYQEERVREIPLKAYWTTFDKLNSRQLKWYFYWRTQVLKKNYPDVDLSYIILFVYELMNYSFNKNAAFNISVMETLYQKYKDRQPKISNYLPLWIGDMLYELKEQNLAKVWSDHTDYHKSPTLYDSLKENKPLQEISMNIWNSYINYGRKSAFFEENKRKIYNIFKKGMGFLGDIYDESEDLLIEKWFVIKTYRDVHYPFRSAVIGRIYDAVHVERTLIKPTDQLTEQVTAAMKYSENILRKMNGINHRVKVNEDMLPESLKVRLDAYYLREKAETDEKINGKDTQRFKVVKSNDNSNNQYQGSKIPNPPVTTKKHKKNDKAQIENFFDTTQIEKLSEETNDLVDLFANDQNDDIDDTEEKHCINIENPDIDGQAIDTLFLEMNGLDINRFLDSLTDSEKLFILLFKNTRDKKVNKESALAFAKEHGLMLGVIISELNDKSVQYLGDILIEDFGRQLKLFDDFDSLLESLGEGVVNEN